MSEPTSQKAYVTLITKDQYLAGTLVLNHTLQAVQSKYPLVVMYTTALSTRSKEILQSKGLKLVEIESLNPPEGAHDLKGFDARFADTWTKLRSFGLTDYERVVMLDSDMVVRKNMDELFDIDLSADQIAAAHACACNPRKFSHYPADWIPANCAHTAVTHPTGAPVTPPLFSSITQPRPHALLNSGLVVLNPSQSLFEALVTYLATSPKIASFSFPDQDLLAHFFEGKWKSLNWYYNALKPLKFIHEPLWDDSEVRCLHYILPEKPWHIKIGEAREYEQLHLWWWDALAEVQKELDEETTVFVRKNIPALQN
jgi:alpha-N-acetylglucosamine transferase